MIDKISDCIGAIMIIAWFLWVVISLVVRWFKTKEVI
jgi:hypothetical protein